MPKLQDARVLNVHLVYMISNEKTFLVQNIIKHQMALFS